MWILPFSLLLSHGLAKALLFMSAASVIFNTNCQNITELGGIWSRMPATTTAYLTGALGIMALLPSGMLITFQSLVWW